MIRDKDGNLTPVESSGARPQPGSRPGSSGGYDSSRGAVDFGAGATWKQLKGGNSIGLGGVFVDLLRRTAEPASAVAYLASGDTRGAGESLLDIFRPQEKQRTIGLSDVPAIHKLTQGLPWYVRAPTRFAIDVAGDPLTYVTFGAAGVGKGAAGSATKTIGRGESELVARLVRQGAGKTGPERLPMLQDLARAAARTAAEKNGLDRALQVGLRAPWSREKGITLGGVNLSKLGRGLGLDGGAAAGLKQSTRSSFLPSRGASSGMRHIHQTLRRAGEVEARAWQKEAQDLGKRIYQRARANNVTPQDLNRLIARHLDDPTAHQAPGFAQDLVDETRAIFDRIGARELQDGVRRGELENYVPHVILKDPGQRARTAYNDPIAAFENPGFARERAAKTFAQLDAQGIKYETNIERLIEHRALASTRTRVKHAVDTATFEQHGVGRNLATNPDDVQALDDARTAFITATDEYRRAQAAGVKGKRLAELRAARAKATNQLRRAAKPVDKAAAIDAKLQALPVKRLSGTKAEWRALRQGWDEVPTAPRYKDARLPPDVARDLKAVHSAIGDSMRNPVAPLRFMRSLSGTWKRLALATPGFHARNQLDDGLRAWWAGARNPQSWGQSARILRGTQGTVRIGGKTMRGDELLDLARAHGVIDVGFVAQEAASSESRGLARSGVMRHGAGRYGNALKLSEDVGGFREDWNRLALFLERLKAGDNAVQAAEVTRKFLFDYGDIGAFVNTARRYWTPFITYATKAIPAVAGEFARHPGRMSHIYAAQRGAWQEAGMPDMSELAPEDRLALPLPPQLSELLSKVTGAQPDAEGNYPTLLLNPNRVMSYATLNDLANVRGWRGVEQQVSGYLSPFVKAPMEFIPGRSMYFGNNFPKRQKANAVETLISMATGGVGFGDKKDPYTGDNVLGINPRYSYALRMLPQVGQVSSVLALAPGLRGTNTSGNLPALRTTLGLPITSVDRAKRRWTIEKYGEN